VTARVDNGNRTARRAVTAGIGYGRSRSALGTVECQRRLVGKIAAEREVCRRREEQKQGSREQMCLAIHDEFL